MKKGRSIQSVSSSPFNHRIYLGLNLLLVALSTLEDICSPVFLFSYHVDLHTDARIHADDSFVLSD